MSNRRLSRTEILDMVKGGELETEEAEKLLLAVADGEAAALELEGELDDFPAACPSCGSTMVITKSQCSQCSVTLDGTFAPCVFCTLDREQQELLHLFLKTRGNLKEMGRSLDLSYPTVRSRLEALLLTLGVVEKEELSPLSVIRALRDGKMDVDEACKLLGDSGQASRGKRRRRKRRW